MYDISKKINFNNLTYHFKGSNTAPKSFIDLESPMCIYNEIKNDNLAIEKIEEDQKHFKSKHKSKDQLDTIKNIKNLCNSRDKTIKLYNDYANFCLKVCIKQNKEQDLKY